MDFHEPLGGMRSWYKEHFLNWTLPLSTSMWGFEFSACSPVYVCILCLAYSTWRRRTLCYRFALLPSSLRPHSFASILYFSHFPIIPPYSFPVSTVYHSILSVPILSFNKYPCNQAMCWRSAVCVTLFQWVQAVADPRGPGAMPPRHVGHASLVTVQNRKSEFTECLTNTGKIHYIHFITDL